MLVHVANPDVTAHRARSPVTLLRTVFKQRLSPDRVHSYLDASYTDTGRLKAGQEAPFGLTPAHSVRRSFSNPGLTPHPRSLEQSYVFTQADLLLQSSKAFPNGSCRMQSRGL